MAEAGEIGTPLDKECGTCGKNKPIDLFYRQKGSVDCYSYQCISCIRASQKKKRGSDKYKEDYRVYMAKYRKVDVEKIKARGKLNKEVTNGNIKKLELCELCGESGNIEGHHWSYEEEYWTDVVWLCKPCHGSVHRESITDRLKRSFNE